MTNNPRSTAAAPAAPQMRPPGKAVLPTMTSTTTPMTSVKRSATTMGAVVCAGTPCVSARTRLLKTSPTLPGVTVSTKPEKNVKKLSSFGTPRMPRRAR